MRAFADVIDRLWRGEISATAAIRLETLWNELAAARGESFMSSYALGHFDKGPLAGPTRQASRRTSPRGH